MCFLLQGGNKKRDNLKQKADFTIRSPTNASSLGGESPRRHKEKMQTPHRTVPVTLRIQTHDLVVVR